MSKQFLVSSYWRGAMNVSNMRVFDDIDQAVKYAHSIDIDPMPNEFSCFVRVYELFTDKPPTQIKKYKKE